MIVPPLFFLGNSGQQVDCRLLCGGKSLIHIRLMPVPNPAKLFLSVGKFFCNYFPAYGCRTAKKPIDCVDTIDNVVAVPLPE